MNTGLVCKDPPAHLFEIKKQNYNRVEQNTDKGGMNSKSKNKARCFQFLY